MLKRLFEQEVPEIFDGTVEIRAIAREAGDRSKLAVYSNDLNVDAVGTCVGPKGSRVQTIVSELKGENMDIIEWSDDPAQLIANALNPANVLEVHFVPNESSCVVVVPDRHLSLAIGKRGQNARLAAKLTNYKIDIKAQSDFEVYKETEEYQQRFLLVSDEENKEEALPEDAEASVEANELLDEQASLEETSVPETNGEEAETVETSTSEETVPAEEAVEVPESKEETETAEVAEKVTEEATEEAPQETLIED